MLASEFKNKDNKTFISNQLYLQNFS